MSKFRMLDGYIGFDSGARRFLAVDESDVAAAERGLGLSLPPDLKEFYRLIGYGWLGSADRPDVRNLFVHPLDILDLYKGQSEHCPEEGFLNGDVPFFDCGRDRFLVVRPSSAEPGKVYRDSGEDEAIAANIEELVSELLRDPVFYEM